MEFDRLSFWKDPASSGFSKDVTANCVPEYFLGFTNVSAMFVDTMTRFAKPSWSILEIGCGTGRNLVALRAAGFTHVSGIEISRHAIDVGRAHFPEYEDIPVICAPVEDVIKGMDPVDVIITQSCLMHIPFELNWVLEEIGHKAQRLIHTFEGELSRGESFHTWRRNYQKVFEPLGWHQVEIALGDTVPPAPPTTIKRVFLPNIALPEKPAEPENLVELEIQDEPIKAPVKMPVPPKRARSK